MLTFVRNPIFSSRAGSEKNICHSNSLIHMGGTLYKQNLACLKDCSTRSEEELSEFSGQRVISCIIVYTNLVTSVHVCRLKS